MYLIGLTGDIASGKSTVLQMLQELGARAIDADALVHVVQAKGGTAYQPVVEAFGTSILGPDGEIDRQKLGAIVFADPARLRELEAIVHPEVSRELAILLLEARERVVVIEAVKLVEAGLHHLCDAVWIVTVSRAEALRRLVQDRAMSEQEALLRLDAQPPVGNKLAIAAVVIDNSGTVQETREQVRRAFAAIRLETASDKSGLTAKLLAGDRGRPEQREPGGTTAAVRRARPGDFNLLARALAQAEGAGTPLERAEVVKRFGHWGYWLAERNGVALALAAWKAENLVAVIRDLWVQTPGDVDVIPSLLASIQKEAGALACEVACLIAAPANVQVLRETLEACGYTAANLHDLHPIWRRVVKEELAPGETLYLKKLREDMVTRPI